MTTLRTLVVSSVLLAACNQGAPAKSEPAKAEPAKSESAKAPGSLPEKQLPPGDPHAEPPPGEDPPAMAVVPSTEGTLDAMIDGKPAHFVRLAPGQNRAVVLPGDTVGRISIGGSEDDTGLPHLRLIVEGVRPDQIEYPLTLGTKTDASPKGLSIRYEVNEKRIYVLDPTKGAEAKVTLEAWEGKTLRGTFEGKVVPTAAGLGGPIPISGKFAVTLGLQGIEPGPTAPAQPDAPKPDATKTDAPKPATTKTDAPKPAATKTDTP